MTRTMRIEMLVTLPESAVNDEAFVDDFDTLAESVGDFVSTAAYDALVEVVREYKTVAVETTKEEEVE